MPEATCRHNWCDTDHDIEESGQHESRDVRIAGIPTTFGIPYVQTSVCYTDTDDAPHLYIGGSNVRLTAAGLDDLMNVLQEQRQIMQSVQAVSVNA